MDSDHRLLADIRNGDQQAFECIYDRYRDRLLNFSTSLYPDAHLAEDIVHDVFLAFFQKAPHLQLRTSLWNYLSASIRNAIIDIFRQRSRIQPYHYKRSSEIEQEAPGDLFCILESCRRVRQCMHSLPAAQRDVLILRAYLSLPFSAIANRQGICSSTARGRYRYGIEKLGTLMRRGA